MKIIVAPDSFKGSVASIQAAKLISKAIREVDPHASVVEIPMADGGEGTVDAILLTRNGEKVTAEVEDPLGRPVKAAYGWIAADKTAVIETAAASGLPLLASGELDPEKASSYGTGELIRHALDKGAETIILGLGGSATVDGGTGIFEALGLKLFDEDGEELHRVGGRLHLVSSADTSLLDERLGNVNIIVASDVVNPLLGKDGAIMVFGPQKGVTPDKLDFLERGMHKFARVIQRATGRDETSTPGSGAAGGIGFLLHSLLNTEFRSGLDLMLEVSNMNEHLKNADLVLTGEGKIDGQSLFGKVPVGIARAAQKEKVPVVAFAGTIGSGIQSLEQEGIATVIPITDKPMNLEEAMQQGEILLYEAAKRMMTLIMLGRHITGRERST